MLTNTVKNVGNRLMPGKLRDGLQKLIHMAGSNGIVGFILVDVAVMIRDKCNVDWA
jgi:hypothetical protein